MSDLVGKRALITGGASGIGRGIADYFVEHGARVALLDTKADDCEKAAAELGANVAVPLAGDVGDSLDVQRAVSDAVTAFGGLDVVVNNAGTTTKQRLLDFDEEDFDRIIRVNLRGAFLGTKWGGRALAESGGGAIINIAAVAALRVYGYGAAYSASKAGVVLLTQVAAADLREYGIRANVVCPGAIDTPLRREHLLEADRRHDPMVEGQGRIGTPRDIAAVVAFLASDEATLINGVVIPVDGGRSCMVAYPKAREKGTGAFERGEIAVG